MRRESDMNKTLDVIIPTYHPGERLELSLKRLLRQTRLPERIIIMNTEEELWDGRRFEKLFEGSPVELSVFHLKKEKFDHGGTRHAAMLKSQADVCVLMTHDAVPCDPYLLERLSAALEPDYAAENLQSVLEKPGGELKDMRKKIAVAYAKQLPASDCGRIERYTRQFNYPDESLIKGREDLERLGIKTYFCSNVCAAYRRDIYLELGGFIRKTIFNEDMIFAAAAVQAGYRIAYAADARVIHSHNYTAMEQLRRNFDLAVSQADHPEVFGGISSEGEGIRLVKATAQWLAQNGRGYLIPKLVWHSGCKYMGYALGKRYRQLPKCLIRRLTMNKRYWEHLTGEDDAGE